MATRTFVDSKGNSWEWEESKETVELLENYWKMVQTNKQSQDA